MLAAPRTDPYERLSRIRLLPLITTSRGGLSFTFVEVKYRRNLRAARSPELIQLIDDQTQLHRNAWMDWYFDGKVADPLLAIRRSRLVRALRFYLEKARRHYLDSAQYERFRQQLDRVMTDGSNYKFTEPSIANRGYIFCPEYTNSDPLRISESGATTTTILFGATTMPDLAVGVERSPTPVEPTTPRAAVADKDSSSVPDSGDEKESVEGSDKAATRRLDNPATEQIHENKIAQTKSVSIRFGVDKSSDEPVEWSVSSYANPHLMIVGFPGMGKTEAVMNICQQLNAQSITPIVFSYHPDIDERLSEKLADVQLLDHQQLGFNPMHLDTVSRTAHVDSAGMLRDVFAAMFPDLGDIQ